MAAFRGSGGSLPPASNGGAPEVDPALYRNLVEMFPLMESFMVCVCVHFCLPYPKLPLVCVLQLWMGEEVLCTDLI